MYTSGHNEILTDAMKLVGFEFDQEEMKKLEKALAYPDFPCGSLSISDADEIVEKLETCGVVKLAIAFAFDKLSLGNQSHNGFYSLWHSMTVDPSKTVENVVKNVREYVLICSKLAYERDSLFWLGFALHIVMDSYSPAHVIRSSQKQVPVDDLKVYMALRESNPFEIRDSLLVKEIVANVVAKVASGMKPQRIIESYPKGQRDAVAFVIFDHLQRREMGPLIAAANVKSKTKVPILNFLFYAEQSGSFHREFDRLKRVKEAGLYGPCVRDVAKMLKIFRGRSKWKLDEYLAKIGELSTFRISNGCEKVLSGFDIETVMKRPTTAWLSRSGDTFAFSKAEIQKKGDRFLVPISPSCSRWFRFRSKTLSCSSQCLFTFFEGSVRYPISIQTNDFLYTGPRL